MNFFRGINILYKKELKDHFLSPLIYILSGLFVLMMGWLFFNYIVLSKEVSSTTLTNSVLRPIFGNMNFIFLFLTPLMTMRSFAEEKKMHTLELLFTSKLGHLQIILGKFLAIVTVSSFMLMLTFIFPIVLAFSGYSDWGVVISSYIGLLFSIMCYCAVGIFSSSLTDNQVVSAIVTFCLLLGFMLLVLSANATHNPLISQMAQYISVPFHFDGLSRGSLKNYNFIYFASFMSFFFYLTHKSLDSRNW